MTLDEKTLLNFINTQIELNQVTQTQFRQQLDIMKTQFGIIKDLKKQVKGYATLLQEQESRIYTLEKTIYTEYSGAECIKVVKKHN